MPIGQQRNDKERRGNDKSDGEGRDEGQQQYELDLPAPAEGQPGRQTSLRDDEGIGQPHHHRWHRADHKRNTRDSEAPRLLEILVHIAKLATRSDSSAPAHGRDCVATPPPFDSIKMRRPTEMRRGRSELGR